MKVLATEELFLSVVCCLFFQHKNVDDLLFREFSTNILDVLDE